MKKIIYILSAVMILLTSCSSDQSEVIPENGGQQSKMHVVSIKLNGEQDGTSTRSTSGVNTLEAAGVKHLHYLVYKDSDKQLVKYKDLFESGPVIKDTLPEGKYIMAILATTSPAKIVSGYELAYAAQPHTFSNGGFFLLSPSSNLDFFYGSFELNVASDMNPTDQETFFLSRITAKVEIVPTDAASVPDNIKSVYFGLESFGGQMFKFATKQVTYMTGSAPSFLGYITQSISRAELMQASQANPISTLLLAGGEDKINYPLYAIFQKNGEDQVYPSIIKQSMTIKRNKVLQLTGKLFDNKTAESGDITANTQWGETVDLNFD